MTPRTCEPTSATVAEREAGYALVEVLGEIDILTRHELSEALSSAGGSGVDAVIVDLSGVTYLSAAGFHCLQQAADALAERGGCLHVVCPPERLTARILPLFDPGGRWPVHADVATALGRRARGCQAVDGSMAAAVARSTNRRIASGASDWGA